MKKSQKGFTIIEVALVLAIGALIFLVVFLAVPALQRNQRNDARKRDISNVVEFVSDYNANNPTGKFNNNDQPYLGSKPNTGSALGKFFDQLSNNTDMVKVTNSLPAATVNETSHIYIIPQKKCKSDTNSTGNLNPGSARQSAVVGYVEVGSNGYQYYCSDAS